MKRILTAVLYLGMMSQAFATGLTEQQKIDTLLDTMAKSDIVFIRHEKEFTAEQGKQFLVDKMHNTEPKVSTAKGFIKDVASKGKITGQPFFIKTKDGKKVQSEQWFTQQLEAIEKANGGSSKAAKAGDKPAAKPQKPSEDDIDQ